MSLILTAHQPGYNMWLGTFAKIAEADMFVSFDAVQYERKGWLNRNYIKTRDGPLLLTVPVESKDHFSKRICDVEIVGGNWARKHLRSIEIAYSKAPHFADIFYGLEKILESFAEGGQLAALNFVMLRYCMGALGLFHPVKKASDHHFKGEKSALVWDMCRQLGATEYIFGGEGESYADIPAFERSGIKCRFQKYEPKPYPQLHGAFVPRMGAIDLLMNTGPEARNYL